MSANTPTAAALRAAERMGFLMEPDPPDADYLARIIDCETGLPELLTEAHAALYCLTHDAAKETVDYTIRNLRAAIDKASRSQ